MPTRDKESVKRSLPRYFRKSTVLIYTVPNIGPFARKIWNILACLDQKGITPNKRYEINLKELCELIHYKSNDHNSIKAALLELSLNTIKSIKGDIEDKITLCDKLLRTTYLESLDISKGIISYQYSDLLVTELSEPEMFAKLDLDSLRRLPRTKAIILFEIAGRHVENGGYKGYNSPWSLFYFRTLMGANSKTYASYKYLNSKIISPCLQTINDLTDLEITLIPGKTRRVKRLKFHVIQKVISSDIYDKK